METKSNHHKMQLQRQQVRQLARPAVITCKQSTSVAATKSATIPSRIPTYTTAATKSKTLSKPTIVQKKPTTSSYQREFSTEQATVTDVHRTCAKLTKQLPTHAATSSRYILPGTPNKRITVLHHAPKADDSDTTTTPRLSRRHLTGLTTMQQRTLQEHEKNEEALMELQDSIPEMDKIFDVHCRIGSGTFSTVLLGTLQRERDLNEAHRRRFAIKHHNPTNHPERILRELECMYRIGGVDNVIGINSCIRSNDNIAFIMPYMSHHRFHDIYRNLTLYEIMNYMYSLLVALRRVHKFNVIHRDVKPSNILFNRHTRQFLLCDFGLAQHLGEDGNVIPASEICATALASRMEASKEFMLRAGTVDGTTSLEEQQAAEALNKEQQVMQQVRATGGGLSADKTFVSLPSRKQTFEERRSKAYNSLTHQEQSNQKADTLRLINRLRHVTLPGDPNNYVISTNSKACKELHASRAGTPGYRPPEVLLRYPHQTTAVDIWAAGVIMLSLLSTLHPFFKAPSDCAALSEIMNVFGDLVVRKTAFMLDRLVVLSQKVHPLDLRRLCMRFRHSEVFLASDMQRRHRRSDGSIELCRQCEQATYNCVCKSSNHVLEPYDEVDIFPLTAYDLLARLLEVNPAKRITAEEALNHPFFSGYQYMVPSVQAKKRVHRLVVQNKESLSATAARSLKPYVVESAGGKPSN